MKSIAVQLNFSRGMNRLKDFDVVVNVISASYQHVERIS